MPSVPSTPTAATEPSGGPIVCFGDSYTEGWGAEPHEAFPALLETWLGIPVVNAGWRGDTAEEGMTRIDESVFAYAPRLVTVEFGGNEEFRGYPVKRALAGIDAILGRLTAAEVPALVLGVRLAEYGDAWELGLRETAARRGAGLMFGILDGILEDPALVSDPMHPNARGYEVVARRVLPSVERALAAKR